MEEIYLSKEGLEKLKKELWQLKNVKRKQVVERIKESKSYGDINENLEYEDAKNEQAFIEGRIQELENIFKKAKIIQKTKTDKVLLGSVVKVKFDGQEEEFIIVGSKEADPASGKISSGSPLGRALMEKSVGDEVEVETPSGKLKYKIISIE